jgi:hypothetical protein
MSDASNGYINISAYTGKQPFIAVSIAAFIVTSAL